MGLLLVAFSHHRAHGGAREEHDRIEAEHVEVVSLLVLLVPCHGVA